MIKYIPRRELVLSSGHGSFAGPSAEFQLSTNVNDISASTAISRKNVIIETQFVIIAKIIVVNPYNYVYILLVNEMHCSNYAYINVHTVI